VIHYQPERLRRNSDQPTAITNALIATSGSSSRTGDIPLGTPTCSARTRHGRWALCPHGDEVVVVWPGGGLVGPAVEVAGALDRLGGDGQDDLDRAAASAIRRFLTDPPPRTAPGGWQLGQGRGRVRPWATGSAAPPTSLAMATTRRPAGPVHRHQPHRSCCPIPSPSRPQHEPPDRTTPSRHPPHRDPPRRRLEGQPCQVRQVGAGDRARRRGRPSAQRCQVGQEGRVGKRGQPRDWPRFPGPPSAAVAAAVTEGPAAARAGPGARCLGDASRRPPSATGDKAITPKPRGRGRARGGSAPWRWSGCGPWRQLASRRLRFGCLVWSSARSTAPGPLATGDEAGIRGWRR
jgi:hypothetical protein